MGPVPGRRQGKVAPVYSYMKMLGARGQSPGGIRGVPGFIHGLLVAGLLVPALGVGFQGAGGRSSSVSAGDGSGGSRAHLAQGAEAAEEGAERAGQSARRYSFERPRHVRGIYVNSWSAGSRRRVAQLLTLAERTEVNTFVIDVKDATGIVSYPTSVPLAVGVGASGARIPDLDWLLGKLEEAGVMPVARIVIAKDPVLAAARPELAVKDSAGGLWIGPGGSVWLDPYNPEVWQYHVALAREAVAAGFPEIQWDYVRFPDAPARRMAQARFPAYDGRVRSDVVREFLAYSRHELRGTGAVVTADVFGVTTSATTDVGIGQHWESFIDVVDVALPMVYPSHYARMSFGYAEPNARPYEIVRTALERAVERSAAVEGAGATRPWLQDFTLGAPTYGAPEVRAQIQATYDAGIDEWVLWNAGSRYTEAALEPTGGFAEDPLIRVGGEVVPASRHHELYRPGEGEPSAHTGAESRGGTPRDSAGSMQRR